MRMTGRRTGKRPLDHQTDPIVQSDDGVGPLDQLLADLDRSAPPDVHHVHLGDLLDAIGPRGFGPVLVLASGLIILPTGMIPLVPHVVAIVLGLVAIEMILGENVLRLPARVRHIRVPGAMIAGLLRRARQVSRPMSRVLRPRFVWLATSRLTLVITALLLAAVAAAKLAIGLIPGLPFLLAVPVCLIGLGLTARDGLAVALGQILLLAPTLMVVQRLV